MDLVADVLDKQVVDRNGTPLGRVDAVIFAVDEDGLAHIAAIEIGLVAIARRVHPLIGRYAAALEKRLGLSPARPVRISFAHVVDSERDVRLDLTASDTASLAIEQRMRSWVGALPGSS